MFFSLRLPFGHLSCQAHCGFAPVDKSDASPKPLFDEPLSVTFKRMIEQKGTLVSMIVVADPGSGVRSVEKVVGTSMVSFSLKYKLRESSMLQYFGKPKCLVQVTQTLPLPTGETQLTVLATKKSRWFEFWTEDESKIIYSAKFTNAQELPAALDQIQAAMTTAFEQRSLPTKI